jgi:predicted lipoprotein with Yx(FWY)xxD motif
MTMKRAFLAATTALVLTSAGALAWADELPKPLKHRKTGDLGTILTGPNGMTLYTYANDKEPGKSVCSGACAENWPPLRPDTSAASPKAPLSVITRDDGSKQYAWKGKPLYYWKNDKKVGDTAGHKFRDVWFVAQP